MENNWKNPEIEMPKDGDLVIAHKWCGFVVGWFTDRMDGVSYEEYVDTYEPDDDDDKPMCKEDYEFHRYHVVQMYSSCGGVDWEDVIGWLPLPDVK